MGKDSAKTTPELLGATRSEYDHILMAMTTVWGMYSTMGDARFVAFGSSRVVFGNPRVVLARFPRMNFSEVGLGSVHG